MTENAYKRFISLVRQSVAARILALVAVFGFCFVLCYGASQLFSISGGVEAASVALGGSLVAGLLSTTICGLPRFEKKPFAQMGFAMVTRLACLIGLTLFVHFRQPELIDSGFVFFLFVFYVADLSLETAMLLSGVSAINKVAG